MVRLVLLCLFLAAFGTPPPETLGDFCADVAPITCDALSTCTNESIANCDDEFVRSCCGADGTCGLALEDLSRGDYNDCLNDLEDRSCAAWTSGAALPSSCQTL